MPGVKPIAKMTTARPAHFHAFAIVLRHPRTHRRQPDVDACLQCAKRMHIIRGPDHPSPQGHEPVRAGGLSMWPLITLSTAQEMSAQAVSSIRH